MAALLLAVIPPQALSDTCNVSFWPLYISIIRIYPTIDCNSTQEALLQKASILPTIVFSGAPTSTKTYLSIFP